MIAKISTGSNTFGMVRYNHSKTREPLGSGEEDIAQGRFLGSENILDNSFGGIVREIENANKRNPDITKPNIHISLSFHKRDVLDDGAIYAIGLDYMERMGFADQPMAVYRHFDRDHPHIHIVSSQIKMDGEQVNDSFRYYRSTKVSRALENKYGITDATNSKDITKAENLERDIADCLEHGTKPILPILRRILLEVMAQRPTTEAELDHLLKGYQVKRTVIPASGTKSTQGSIYHLLPMEAMESPGTEFGQHRAVRGSDLDPNYSHQNLMVQLERNRTNKEALLKKFMGRAYSVLEPGQKLSSIHRALLKKGITMTAIRIQSGKRSGEIRALVFRDNKTGLRFSASDIKLRTKEFVGRIEDDERDQNLSALGIPAAGELSDNEDTSGYGGPSTTTDEPVDEMARFFSTIEGLGQALEQTQGGNDMQITLKKRRKKKKGK